jgi:hypothetical protein
MPARVVRLLPEAEAEVIDGLDGGGVVEDLEGAAVGGHDEVVLPRVDEEVVHRHRGQVLEVQLDEG